MRLISADTPQTLSLQLAGTKEHCPTASVSQKFLLGWNNRTCDSGKAVGPVLRPASHSVDWHTWDVTYVIRHVARLVTHAPSSGPMLCEGPIVVSNLPSCQDSAVTVSALPAVRNGTDLFAIRPVPKAWGGKPGEYNFIAKDRRIGCARFLSALADSCGDSTLKLVDRDDGTGLQRWLLSTSLLPPSSPTISSPGTSVASGIGASSPTSGFVTLGPSASGGSCVLSLSPGSSVIALPASSGSGYTKVPFGGLSPGTSYTGTVRCTLANGTQVTSPPLSFSTPSSSSSPTLGDIIPILPSSLNVSIIPPASGPAPTSYVVKLVPKGGGAPIVVTVPASSPPGSVTNAVLAGLVGGSQYTVTVTPVLSNGTLGTPSAPSTALMPSASSNPHRFQVAMKL